MGGNSIASLWVSIGADLDGLKKGLDGAASELTSRASGLGNAISGALTVGLGAAVIGIGALVTGLTASVQAAMEAEEGQAQLAAVIQSTGGAAGVSAQMANDLASSLQDVTRFEDDAILAGESMLLTFTNIGKDVFPAATETMLNMSQAMGQDLQSSAVQLGKALNDPVAGMSALARVGVTFTDEQKEMIKGLQESGDLMGAQKIILAELEKEFGNSARAAGETFAGKLDILKNKFGDILETIGGAVLPILTQLADALIGALNSELVQNFASALGTIFEYINSLDAGSFSEFAATMEKTFGPEIGGMITAIAEAIRTFVYSLEEGWTPLESFRFALESLFGGEATSAMSDGIMAMVPLIQNAITTIQTIFNSLVEWASGTLGPALSESFGQISEAALPALQMFGEWITTTLLPALQQLSNWLGPILGEAFRGLGIFITDMALPALTALAVWILKTGLPAFGDLANKIGGDLNAAFRTAKTLWDGIVKAFQDSVKFIDETKTKLEETANLIMHEVKTAFDFLQNDIIKPAVEAFAGLKQKVQEVIDMIRRLIDLIMNAPNIVGDFLGGVGGGINDAVGGLLGGGGGGGSGGGLPGGGGNILGGHGRRMRGGGVQINLTYAPVVSLMDEAEAETKLSPFVRAAVRAAMGA